MLSLVKKKTNIYYSFIVLLSVEYLLTEKKASYPLPGQRLQSLLELTPKGHHLVTTEGYKQKACRYCSLIGRKTSTGNTIWTRVKCSVCDVPLCQETTRTQRQCFKLYHEKISYSD